MEAREEERDWQAELAAVTPYFVSLMMTGEGKALPDFADFVLRPLGRKAR
jgi:hypothetical protein